MDDVLNDLIDNYADAHPTYLSDHQRHTLKYFLTEAYKAGIYAGYYQGYDTGYDEGFESGRG